VSRSNFWNVGFVSIYNSGRWTESRNAVIRSVVHLRQNPLDSSTSLLLPYCCSRTHPILLFLLSRVPGYRSRGPGSVPRNYQIFLDVASLERGPLSLVSTIEELRVEAGKNTSTAIPASRKRRREGNPVVSDLYILYLCVPYGSRSKQH
jgi:hypothetical protein